MFDFSILHHILNTISISWIRIFDNQREGIVGTTLHSEIGLKLFTIQSLKKSFQIPCSEFIVRIQSWQLRTP